MTKFRLDPDSPHRASPQPSGWEGLSSDVLFQDARWFTKIRWVIVIAFVAVAVSARWFPGLTAAASIKPATVWPWVLASIVGLVNLVTIAWLRRIPLAKTTRVFVRANIWFQIVADLLVLTALVYLVGTLETVMPFAYLFHIALACIFFAPRESLLVLLLSAGLFLGTMLLEASSILPTRSILIHAGPPTPPDMAAFLTTAFPTVFVWAVVWFLISHISSAVRQRDRELDIANQRLRKADHDKNLQVLRVAHDLKAPLAGIESNIQVLRLSHWERIPKDVRHIVARIEARGTTLRARIGDILTLGDLRSGRDAAPVRKRVPLQDLVTATIRDLQDLAKRRNISFNVTGEEEIVISDPQQLKILLLNLLSNALSYSREDGTVEVTISFAGPAPVLRIADQGIGIDDAALPHIFEDFYRSQDAAQFNSQGTGLGLAIVRQVARNLGLTLNVESNKGEGTTFEVLFPAERRNKDGNDHNH